MQWRSASTRRENNQYIQQIKVSSSTLLLLLPLPLSAQCSCNICCSSGVKPQIRSSISSSILNGRLNKHLIQRWSDSISVTFFSPLTTLKCLCRVGENSTRFLFPAAVPQRFSELRGYFVQLSGCLALCSHPSHIFQLNSDKLLLLIVRKHH